MTHSPSVAMVSQQQKAENNITFYLKIFSALEGTVNNIFFLYPWRIDDY
jgi:hypothetical protein